MAHKLPDFTESSYFKIFSPEGRVIVTEVLNNPDLVDLKNYDAWRMDFDIDPEITKHDSNGFATCTALMREIEHGVMSDDTYGQYDAQLIASYAEKIQTFIDGANMTLTNMGEQLMTNGYVYYDKGAGIHAGIHKADIPAANFLKACVYKVSGGSEVQTTWADTDCLLIDSMNRLVEQINTKLGRNWKWQFDMPKSIFDSYVMKNKQVMTTMFYRTNPGIVLNDAVASAELAMHFTREQVLAMLNDRLDNAIVVIHDTAQYDAFEGIVRGWKSGVVTLRPFGRAGMIRHTDIIDAEWFDDQYSNPAIKDFYVPALNGLGFLNNTIWPNGRDLEYRTRYIYSSTPSLDEFLYHFTLATGTASDNGNWY